MSAADRCATRRRPAADLLGGPAGLGLGPLAAKTGHMKRSRLSGPPSPPARAGSPSSPAAKRPAPAQLQEHRPDALPQWQVRGSLACLDWGLHPHCRSASPRCLPETHAHSPPEASLLLQLSHHAACRSICNCRCTPRCQLALAPGHRRQQQQPCAGWPGSSRSSSSSSRARGAPTYLQTMLCRHTRPLMHQAVLKSSHSCLRLASGQ